ncbi:MAG: hypothetical protein ACQEP1_01790 [Nanobdellota archaeon]
MDARRCFTMSIFTDTSINKSIEDKVEKQGIIDQLGNLAVVGDVGKMGIEKIKDKTYLIEAENKKYFMNHRGDYREISTERYNNIKMKYKSRIPSGIYC